MSQSSPSQSNNTPQASSQALLDELRVAADRARDERLKLARMFKHSADLPIQGSAGSGGSAEGVSEHRVYELTQLVEQLEKTVADKLDAFAKSQQDIESRTQYLESLRHTITQTTAAFTNQVEQAQHFKAHVDAAKKHVKMSAGRVVDDVRQHLAEFEGPIAERLKQLNELDDQIDKRIARMQQMHKQASESVDKHLLAALRSAKEQAADLAEPVKAELDKHLQAQRGVIEKAIHQKIAELDVDVEEALSPLTSQFNQIVCDAQSKADLLAESLPARLEAQVEEQLGKMRETFAKQAEEIASGVDEKTLEGAQNYMRERVAEALDSYLGEAEKECGGYVDGLIAKLDEGREEALKLFKASLTEAASEHKIDHDQVLAMLDEEVARLHEVAKDRVADAQKVLEESVGGIQAQAQAKIDAAFDASRGKIATFECDTAEQIDTIHEGVDGVIAQSQKRLDEHQQAARELGRQARDIVESSIADAQEQITDFEDGIAERIGLANQSVMQAIVSVDERLDEKQRQAEGRIAQTNEKIDRAAEQVDERIDAIQEQAGQRLDAVQDKATQYLDQVEQDAAERVGKIVDLAESSSQAIAESIEALTQSAQATASQAQQDLEEKLRAFEDISAQGLKQAEATLRGNIMELRETSRAMIEVVTNQVKAQAANIEPQTREVIEQAEKTVHRRVGEIRDNAQSMVELAVNRLEGQLNQVKRKAQHAVFQGIEAEAEAGEDKAQGTAPPPVQSQPLAMQDQASTEAQDSTSAEGEQPPASDAA